MINKSKINIYTIVFTCFLLIWLISMISNSESIKISIGEINTLNDQWELVEKDGSGKNIVLPVKLDVKAGDMYSFRIILPDAFSDSQTIRIRSSMEYVKILLDEKTIYDNNSERKLSFPFRSDASFWILVDIPKDSNGLNLEVQMYSDIPIMSGRINDIYYGSNGDLILELIGSQMISILLSLIVLFVSIFLFLISLFVRIPATKRIGYLCIFSLTIGLWLISELDIFQFLSGNIFIVGTISYLVLPIALIAFILYIKIVVLEKYSKILSILISLTMIYLFIGTIMQVFFGVHFIRSWTIFILILILTVSLIMMLLIKESFNQNDSAKKYVLFLIVLIITTVIESVMFITGFFMNISHLSVFGIVIFMMFLFIDSLNDLSEKFQKHGETKYLREIAYKDVLTGGYNRAAFEKDIDQLLSNKGKSPFRMTMFDLNELKKINDCYGHEIGDEAIIEFYNIIDYIYQHELDKCYRVGGDEFMVVELDISDELHHLNMKHLQDKLVIKNKEFAFDLSTAIGSDVYNYERSFGEFKHNVDQKMYENKYNLKK